MRDTPPHSPRPAARALQASPAGRPFTVGRPLLAGAVLIGLALTGWAGAVTYYILFRDEVAQRFFAQQTILKITYEDRISDLSTRLAREVTQGMVERRELETRTDALARRQAAILADQLRLQALAGRIAGIAGPGQATATAALPVLPQRAAAATKPTADASGAKPTPLFDTMSLRTDDRRDASPTTGEPRGAGEAGAARDHLSSLENRAASAQAEQAGLAKLIGTGVRSRVARLRAAVAATGLDVDRHAKEAGGGIGGPLVALPSDRLPNALDFAVADIENDVAELGRLQVLSKRLPLGRPIFGELDETSPFGYRVDPFTRGQALHTGVDLRIEYGGAVRATGSGRVTVAEYSGGYGNLVEIDHGGGVVTRYGHLSSFLVAPGDVVAAGSLVGRAGSTGRSTGSHVHYETRVNGEPVNPTRFLSAGQLIEAAAQG